MTRTALVTGASRGIGEAIARRLAADGLRVAVCHRDNAERAEAIAAEIGGEAFRADLSQAAAPGDLVERVAASFGRIDVLVNNAGAVLPRPVEEITPDSFAAEVNTNLRAPVFLCQAALAHMGDGASIVNVSSVNSRAPALHGAIYSATKAALDAFTVSLAREVGPRGIRVNAVLPGATATDMQSGDTSPFVERTALGRLGQPDDIAAVVSWLASEEARWVTGERVAASGGFF